MGGGVTGASPATTICLRACVQGPLKTNMELRDYLPERSVSVAMIRCWVHLNKTRQTRHKRSHTHTLHHTTWLLGVGCEDVKL